MKVEKENASALSFILGEEEEELGNLEMEVAIYFTEKPSRRGTDRFVWWEVNAARFPKLAVLAKMLLSVPVTSAPSERLFFRCWFYCL